MREEKGNWLTKAWWHANYSKRFYVYSSGDLADVTPRRKAGFNAEVVTGIDVTPEI